MLNRIRRYRGRSIINVLATPLAFSGYYGNNNNNDNNNNKNNNDKNPTEISAKSSQLPMPQAIQSLQQSNQFRKRIPAGSLPVHFNRPSRASVSINDAHRRHRRRRCRRRHRSSFAYSIAQLVLSIFHPHHQSPLIQSNLLFTNTPFIQSHYTQCN